MGITIEQRRQDAAIEARTLPAQAGDVVQLDPQHCRHGALLCVVESSHPWGLKVNLDAGSGNEIPLRVEHGHYARVGEAEWKRR
jgi:hypothetical protein